MEAIRSTISSVMSGAAAPEMLDSVLTPENVNMSLPDDLMGEVTPLLLATSYGNLPAIKVLLLVS